MHWSAEKAFGAQIYGQVHGLLVVKRILFWIFICVFSSAPLSPEILCNIFSNKVADCRCFGLFLSQVGVELDARFQLVRWLVRSGWVRSGVVRGWSDPTYVERQQEQGVVGCLGIRAGGEVKINKRYVRGGW